MTIRQGRTHSSGLARSPAAERRIAPRQPWGKRCAGGVVDPAARGLKQRLQIRSLNVPPARPSPLSAGCAAGELAVRSGDVPVAARSLSAICLLRSFSTVFAHAEALAATARSLRALVSRSTVGVQSAASSSSTAAWVLWSFSTAVGDGFPAAGRPLWSLLADASGALGGTSGSTTGATGRTQDCA